MGSLAAGRRGFFRGVTNRGVGRNLGPQERRKMKNRESGTYKSCSWVIWEAGSGWVVEVVIRGKKVFSAANSRKGAIDEAYSLIDELS